MADARSLLRAKKATQAPRIDSPHATYTAAGELKCVLCAAKGPSRPVLSCRAAVRVDETRMAALLRPQVHRRLTDVSCSSPAGLLSQ